MSDFNNWVRSGQVFILNPWVLSAPASYLKGAWCRSVQERQRVTLIQVAVTCLAEAAVAAVCSTTNIVFYQLFTSSSPPFSFLGAQEGITEGCGLRRAAKGLGLTMPTFSIFILLSWVRVCVGCVCVCRFVC